MVLENQQRISIMLRNETIYYNIFVYKFVDFIIRLGGADDCAKFNYAYLGAKDHNEPFFDKKTSIEKNHFGDPFNISSTRAKFDLRAAILESCSKILLRNLGTGIKRTHILQLTKICVVAYCVNYKNLACFRCIEYLGNICFKKKVGKWVPFCCTLGGGVDLGLGYNKNNS
ncbi:hypothetical protein AGLY_008615 [Aphis glycines]|uniref:Uncharacterized protein n=1 Tax=Aphis glycines TaxID=307491 RepID=A0A6G0TKI8_APHGL|nr:hypothetical protein AGLY_008615 [Aphis glycines]